MDLRIGTTEHRRGGSPKITICEIFGVVRFGKVEGHPRFMAGSPKASMRAI
jgi:hypothetical protein